MSEFRQTLPNSRMPRPALALGLAVAVLGSNVTGAEAQAPAAPLEARDAANCIDAMTTAKAIVIDPTAQVGKRTVKSVVRLNETDKVENVYGSEIDCHQVFEPDVKLQVVQKSAKGRVASVSKTVAVPISWSNRTATAQARQNLIIARPLSRKQAQKKAVGVKQIVSIRPRPTGLSAVAPNVDLNMLASEQATRTERIKWIGMSSLEKSGLVFAKKKLRKVPLSYAEGFLSKCGLMMELAPGSRSNRKSKYIRGWVEKDNIEGKHDYNYALGKGTKLCGFIAYTNEASRQPYVLTGEPTSRSKTWGHIKDTAGVGDKSLHSVVIFARHKNAPPANIFRQGE